MSNERQQQAHEQMGQRAPAVVGLEEAAALSPRLAAAFASPPPEHPTTRGGRQGRVAIAQRVLGNQAARRLVQRDGEGGLPPVPNYQLTPPSLLGGPRRPGLLGDGPHLQLDPVIEAELRAMQVRALLEPALVRPSLAQLPVGPLTLPPQSPGGQAGLPGGQTPQPAPSPTPQPAPGQAPEPPRAGSAGDILGAIMAVPAVDQAVTQIQNEASERVRRDWRDLRLGGQIGLISVSALIAGGAIAGVASSPDAQRFVFSQLNGKVVPVPGLSFLRVEFNAQDSNLMLGIHVDVGALLPSVLGFGPGSSSAIGGPPQPASPPWAPPAQRSVIRRAPARQSYRSRPAGRVQRLGVAAILGIGAAVVAAGAAIYEAAVSEERSLSEGEIAGAREIFAESIDYSEVTIKRHSLGSVGAPRTIGNTIALSEDCFSGEEGMELSDYGRQTLIHEMAHVWQYQNRGWEYAPGALWAQLKAAVTTGSRNAAYDWESLADAGVPWEEWNPEAQAEAVEDYNNALQKQKAGTAEADDYRILAKAQPYIDLMRAGPPERDAGDTGGPGGDGGGSGSDAGTAPSDAGLPAGAP